MTSAYISFHVGCRKPGGALAYHTSGRRRVRVYVLEDETVDKLTCVTPDKRVVTLW